MKTKLDRVPVDLSELVRQEAERKGQTKTKVYANLAIAMRTAGDISDMFAPRKKDENKPIFRF